VLAGRYRLDHLLAVGGMSEVWAGTDDLLKRAVAVKVLRPGLASHPALVARFRREAVAAARVRHPSVVGVLDTVIAEGEDAVVMELVAGHSLRHLLDDQGRLGPARTAAIGAAVADGLDAVHRAGLVHRDVKPANILLADDGRILVADLGLAKAVHIDDEPGERRTVVGTPKYLAPEQVRGLPVDGRADLYALGVVLFECLTGQVPFTGADDTAVAKARLRGHARPVRDLAPEVPRPLADLVARLLSRDPGRRPGSARVVGDELVRLAADLPPEPEPARPPVPVPAGDASQADPTPAVPVSAGGQRWWMVALASTGVTALLAVAGALLSGTGERPALVPEVLGAPAIASAEPASTSVAPPAPAPAAVVPLEVLGTAEFDPPPDGDGKENPDLLGRITDGDPATDWQSVCYRQDTFAPKAGIGLVLELSVPIAGHQLTVTTPMDGWSGELRVAETPAGTLAGWGPPVASVDSAPDGDVVLDVGSAEGRYVLLLVTRAPEGPACRDARYQARVSEVRVSR
jgi:eukaryotic-like serine/threonine-protein kinase